MVETKRCKTCGSSFLISEDEQAMYQKLDMPSAKKCFKCGTQQRLAFWIFGRFRNGKSDLSGASLITTLPATTDHPVYTEKEWWSDAWDPMSYARDYDPSRSFFDQFKDLKTQVPRPHQTGANSVDCDWCDDVWDSKNCYLSRSMGNCENALYGYRIVNIKDSVDITYSFDIQQSYDCTYCFNCFKVRHALNSRDSLDSSFIYDCRNVQHCFMCWNLRNKKYCIRNQQYSKDEYFSKLKEYNLGSWQTIQALRAEWNEILREQAVHRENFNFKSVDSSGNFLNDCKTCKNCYHWEQSENCYNGIRGLSNKTTIDTTGVWKAELVGNFANSVGGYMIKYASWTHHCRYSEYLDQCVDCENCFGCVGLKKKSYCILNKQYSRAEYEKLRLTIVDSMKKEGVYGEFFPYQLSTFGYNLTLGNIYFPETRESALKKGMLWDDSDSIRAEGVLTADLPDDIKNVPDGLTAQPLVCPETSLRFNISPRELVFYRQMNVPVPRTHFDVRTLSRFKWMNVIDTHPYQCVFCKKKIQAYYPQEFGYKKVACVDCYQKNIA